jgi:hypothetical protein
VVVKIGDEHVAAVIHRKAIGPVQVRACGRATIASKAFHPSPCKRSNKTRGCGNPADAVVFAVGDEHIAADVHHKAERGVEPRDVSEAAVTLKPARTGASERSDDARPVRACRGGCRCCRWRLHSSRALHCSAAGERDPAGGK